MTDGLSNQRKVKMIRGAPDMWLYERTARALGYRLIAGGDEAGRGPWAGPVFAAFVILPDDFNVSGVDDSKKLTQVKREVLFEQIKAAAVTYGIGSASPEEIDRINILQATRLAFFRAFEALNPKPDYLLLDYIKVPLIQKPAGSITRGDSLSTSIAAASILAKVARDRQMEYLDAIYPGYGFAYHKGYGTPAHVSALEKLGPASIHRKSFKPVKKLLEKSL